MTTTAELDVTTLVIELNGIDGVGPSSTKADTTTSTRKFLPLVDAMVEDTGSNASGLPRFANRCQFKANLLTTTSNTLAALTGLAIWASVEASPAWWAKAAMAFTALLSAVLGFIPGIYHWSDNATTARDLACRYGRLHGDVLTIQGRIREGDQVGAEEIEKARTSLETLKKERQEINAEWP